MVQLIMKLIMRQFPEIKIMPNYYLPGNRIKVNDLRVSHLYYGNIWMMRIRRMMNNAIINPEPKMETLYPKALYYPARDCSGFQLSIIMVMGGG
jgi:hypothetical protein